MQKYAEVLFGLHSAMALAVWDSYKTVLSALAKNESYFILVYRRHSL